MLIKCLPVILLPAVAFSSISIKIRPGKTADDVSIDVSGTDEAIISDLERKTFRFTDEDLYKGSEKRYYGRCDQIFIKLPTDRGNPWRVNDWDFTMRILKPVKGRVTAINAKPVAVASAEYVNSLKRGDVTYSTTVSQSVEESISHSWTSGGELSIAQEINYGINFGVASIGGVTSLSYTSTWGEDKTESRTVTLGTTSSVLTTLSPGEKVVAVLTATRGSLDIEVDYETSLTNGDIVCRYKDRRGGPELFAYSVQMFQKALDSPRVIRTTEKLSIGFYTSARLEVRDASSDEEIQEESAGIIGVGPQREV